MCRHFNSRRLADHTGKTLLGRETFHSKKEIQIVPKRAKLTGGHGCAKDRCSIMNSPAKRRLPLRLHYLQRVQALGHVCHVTVARVPIDQHSIAKKFAERSAVVFDYFL